MPNQVRQEWHGEEIVARLVATSWDNLVRATVFLWQECTKALNASAGPYSRTRTRTTAAGPKGSSYTAYAHPSGPDEPPHKRTGWGQRHVLYELDKANLKSRVGVSENALYMAMHEAGIRGVKRSWLLSTLDAHLNTIRALASGQGG